MYKVTMMFVDNDRDVCVDLPDDKHLGFFEACYRADLYKEKNAGAVFTVIRNKDGDEVYQV